MNSNFKVGDEVQFIDRPLTKFVVTYVAKDGLISGVGLDGSAFVDKIRHVGNILGGIFDKLKT